MAAQQPSDASAVASLFNRKAATWSEKYASAGALAGRGATMVETFARVLPPPADVLDFGCGTGDLARRLVDLGYAVTGCDISGAMILRARELTKENEIAWVHLPPTAHVLPFGSASFSGVLASSVLEYVPNVQATLRELRRVLREPGFLIATVPNKRHAIRRLEAMARPALAGRLAAAGCRRWPRLRDYAAYVVSSCNRFSEQQWTSLAHEAGFALEFATPEGGRRHAALQTLIFRTPSPPSRAGS